MAITITFSTDSVTLDETSGLQFLNSAANTAGATDNDDNDVARTTLPTPFSDRLNDLGLSTAFPDLVGVATGTIATVSSDSTPITGVAFNFTNGVSSSFFDLDDNKIFLFHDATDPNIVLLREGTGTVANSSGAIVGAIYLDVDVDGTSTSETVKVWLVQFEAFANLDPTNPDDFLTLANLSLSASSTVDFNFAGAPSGQNYFMAFGDPSAGVLLVSGKDPVDDTDLNQIGDGDTVNTGQGGGDTTLGTNNQKIVSGEGLHFRFVTGMSSGVVAPLLDQNEADVEANTAFTGFLDVTGASVDIVQLQPGSPKAVATVKLSAFSADDTAPLESGTHFAEELDDDDPVTIDGVQVIRNGQDVVGTDVLATFNSDGTLTLTGIKDGDEIKYTTDGTHNHVLVENAGDKKTADFDIGGFHIIQAETESAPIPNILFDDDGPVLADPNNTVVSFVKSTLTVDSDVAEPQVETDGNDHVAVDFNPRQDAKGASLDITDFTDPDDATDLANSGLGALEAVLGNITATQVGNTVTYFSPDGSDAGTAPDPLFKLTLNTTDPESYDFQVLRDALPVIEKSAFFDFGSGSPVETIRIDTDVGVDVVFDGLLFDATDARDIGTAQNLPNNPADDLNPDNLGFGVKNNQASNINNNEGWKMTFVDDANASQDVQGISFVIDQQGNTDDVALAFQLTNNGPGGGNDPTLVEVLGATGQTTNSGTSLDGDSFFVHTTLPGGNAQIIVTIIDDDLAASYTKAANEILIVVDGEFDQALFQATYPQDPAAQQKYTTTPFENDSIRVLDFSVIEQAPRPDVQLSFAVRGLDGDNDPTATQTFTVGVDGNLDGNIIVI